MFLVENRRSSLGFPGKLTAVSWLNGAQKAVWPLEAELPLNGLKNAEIPILQDYGGTASDKFWEKFPSRELPEKASTKVDVVKFKQHVDDVRSKKSITKVRRAERTLHDLVNPLTPK